jgi:hypothetical protein
VDDRRPNTTNPLIHSQLMLFDECGEYEIYQTFLHAAHKSDDDARFGIRFKTLDRVPKLLEHVFPGYTAYSNVALVTKDSLAAKVGLQRHDILCWVDLDGCNSSPCRRVKGGGAMMLFTAAEFVDYIRRLRGQAVLPLYIARRRRVNGGNHHDRTSVATTGHATSATRRKRHLEVESVPSGGLSRQELQSPPVIPCRVGSGLPPSKQPRLDQDPAPMEAGTKHGAAKAKERDKGQSSVSNRLATFADARFPSQEAIQKGTPMSTVRCHTRSG